MPPVPSTIMPGYNIHFFTNSAMPGMAFYEYRRREPRHQTSTVPERNRRADDIRNQFPFLNEEITPVPRQIGTELDVVITICLLIAFFPPAGKAATSALARPEFATAGFMFADWDQDFLVFEIKPCPGGEKSATSSGRSSSGRSGGF